MRKEVDCMFLSCQICISEWIHTLQLPECQETPCSKQVQNLKFKWLQVHFKCTVQISTQNTVHNHLEKNFRPVWSSGLGFVYELSGSGFESSCRKFVKNTKFNTLNKKVKNIGKDVWCVYFNYIFTKEENIK